MKQTSFQGKPGIFDSKPAQNSGPSNDYTPITTEETRHPFTVRFGQIVSDHGSSVAISCGTGKLTYEELDRRANHLARRLAALSEQDNHPVALLFPRGAELITAKIACLKAGVPYIPLDPGYPEARNRAILRDSTARLLLYSQDMTSIPAQGSRDSTRSYSYTVLMEQPDRGEPLPALRPDTPAYILYTSGSTGTPRGVIHTHRSLLCSIKRYSDGLHINHTDRLSHISSPSFSMSVLDIYGALLNGASLHSFDVASEGLEVLQKWIIDQELTIYHSVSTLCLLYTSDAADE